MLAACISQCFHVKPLCSGRVVIARFCCLSGTTSSCAVPVCAIPFFKLAEQMHAWMRGRVFTVASLACNCNAKVPKRHHMGTQRPHAECRAMKLTLYLCRGRQMRWTVDTRVSKHMVALNWCVVQSTADWKYSTFACPFHAKVRWRRQMPFQG